MTAQKSAEPATPKGAAGGQSGRKPWKKRSPAEVIIDQIEKVKQDLANREEELKVARRQLQKLEEVRKVLEST